MRPHSPGSTQVPRAEDPVPQLPWLHQPGRAQHLPFSCRGEGWDRGRNRHWGMRKETFDLCGQHLQKRLGEGPAQVNAMSPGAILLHPSILPRAWSSCCIPLTTCRSLGRAPWAHLNIQAQPVGCPLLRTPRAVPSPATPTPKTEAKLLCRCALPSPCRPGHMREGTAPTANGKVQGQGKPRERHIKGSLCGRSPSAVLIQG